MILHFPDAFRPSVCLLKYAMQQRTFLLDHLSFSMVKYCLFILYIQTIRDSFSCMLHSFENAYLVFSYLSLSTFSPLYMNGIWKIYASNKVGKCTSWKFSIKSITFVRHCNRISVILLWHRQLYRCISPRIITKK